MIVLANGADTEAAGEIFDAGAAAFVSSNGSHEDVGFAIRQTARASIDLGFKATVIASATATRALPDALGAALEQRAHPALLFVPQAEREPGEQQHHDSAGPQGGACRTRATFRGARGRDRRGR